jgi:phosphoenolpyruvate synthase/pyruvate phosphate dikinase
MPNPFLINKKKMFTHRRYVRKCYYKESLKIHRTNIEKQLFKVKNLEIFLLFLMMCVCFTLFEQKRKEKHSASE